MTVMARIFREEFLCPAARPHVIAIIRAMNVPDGQKRATYLRWLLAAKVEYGAGDLEDVIARRPGSVSTGGQN